MRRLKKKDETIREKEPFFNMCYNLASVGRFMSAEQER